MTDIIDGNEVAQEIRDGLVAGIDDLTDSGTTPCLATVLMNNDPASQTYVSMKHKDCEEVGITTRDIELDPEAPASELFETVDELNADPEVHGILVQMPLPDHVDEREVLRRIDPAKDVDGFHPENVGRLVAGNPRFKPCTPHGVQKLLAAADVETEGFGGFAEVSGGFAEVDVESGLVRVGRRREEVETEDRLSGTGRSPDEGRRRRA